MWVFDRLSPSVLPPASVFSLLSLCGRLIYFQSLKLYLFSNTILYGPGTVVGTETKAVAEASKKRFPLMEFTFIRKETNKQVNYYYFFIILPTSTEPGLGWAGTHTEEGWLGTLDTSWVNALRWKEEAKWSMQQEHLVKKGVAGA